MPPRKKIRNLEQADFDRLLSWLDPDRERAGVVYEQIRWRLITILASRECRIAEELADEVMNRVARRVADIEDTYSGEKVLYFFGVANNVHHEYLKRESHRDPVLPQLAETDVDKERMHDCLEACLGKLSLDSRQLILRYYSEEKQAKIDLRKRVADELGVTLNTLRLRALRIREKLQTCIDKCVDAELEMDR